MTERLPDYLSRGELARLFPVLSTTSKEGRTTSILLACLDKIDELAVHLLGSVDQKVGKRALVQSYTEVCFKSQTAPRDDRPDGLIVLKVGKREWRALIEAKIGASELDVDQIERYRTLAKENGIDCVITISNQFATTPLSHPLEAVRKSRSKIPVFHWSWMHVLTTADLLISGELVADKDQRVLLNELRRFLSHESAGVRGFERMPSQWTELNRLVSSGGLIGAKSPEAQEVIEAWHQETRDLSMILSRLTETIVHQRLPKAHVRNASYRIKDELAALREDFRLTCNLEVPDAAAPIEVVADLARRCFDVGMTLKAPGDRKSTKARVNWILRQIKEDAESELFLRLLWPGKSVPTQFLAAEIRNHPEICRDGKEHLVPHSFHLFMSRRTGARFTQQTNFIVDLEKVVPEFYRRFGSNLKPWAAQAPKFKPEKDTAEEVAPGAISMEAEEFGGQK